MKKNILAEVMKQQYCAICSTGESITHRIVPLSDVNKQPLHICQTCYDEELIKTGSSCTYCGKIATYGTWRTRRWNQLGGVNTKDITREPHHRILCETHFNELLEEVKSRERQSNIKDF